MVVVVHVVATVYAMQQFYREATIKIFFINASDQFIMRGYFFIKH